jgi:hypothetical protein
MSLTITGTMGSQTIHESQPNQAIAIPACQARWGIRGAILGASLGLILVHAIAFQFLVFGVQRHQSTYTLRNYAESLMIVPLFAVLGVFPALTAAIVWQSIRPLLLAVFADPARFEQEYGNRSFCATKRTSPGPASGHESGSLRD